MLIKVSSAKCVGINAVKVMVEVDIRSGVGIHLVGLADMAVKESLLRIITALQSLGFHIPGNKIVINLAPADLHKSGSGYDLPISLGIIAASGQRSLPALCDYLIMGELGLDSSVRDVPGALAFAEYARDNGLKGCILPAKSSLETIDILDTVVYGVENISEVIRILEDKEDCSDLLAQNLALKPKYLSSIRDSLAATTNREYPDFCDIIGQNGAKRGVEIAAAGGHNIIMIGSPGSGKSSLAKAMAGILPPMTREESLVTSKIYSVASKRTLTYGLIKRRPVRSPHYSASIPSIIGGGSGSNIVPGEVSLAHNGILFMDEFAQMPKSVIEALRGPLEDREVSISRLKAQITFPSSFMLVAASNPCPCGYYGEKDLCTCTVGARQAYMSKLSGPIMDRIDLQLWMHPIETSDISSKLRGESSCVVAQRVRRAREIQSKRFEAETINTNSEMDNKMISKYCGLSEECQELLLKLMEGASFSMRAYYRIIKVARTIADLDETQDIRVEHIAEAASYRFLDRKNTL